MPRRHISYDVKRLLVEMTHRVSVNNVVELTGISRSTIKRAKQRWRATGDVVSPYRQQLGRPPILSSSDIAYLRSCVARQPDITKEELRAQLARVRNTRVSASTIRRCLALKEPSSRNKRPDDFPSEYAQAKYISEIVEEGFRPHHLVFVGHTSIHLKTATSQVKRYYIQPSVSLSGILHLDANEYAFSTDIFNIYVEGLLGVMNPWPAPNSVLVVEDTPNHQLPELVEMVEAKGCRLLYLPPGSPELNPMVEAFSAIRAWVRQHRGQFREALKPEAEIGDVDRLIWKAVFSATPADIRGWYRQAGYL